MVLVDIAVVGMIAMEYDTEGRYISELRVGYDRRSEDQDEWD